MLERLLDRDHDYGRRLFAVDGETLPERGIGADPRPAVDPIGLVGTGDQKDQPDAGVLDEVFEAVDPIVASTVGDQQGAALILDLNKARLVAFRRAIEPLVAAGCEDEKRRGGDEGTSRRVDVVDFLFQDALRWPRVKCSQLADGCHGGVVEPIHPLRPLGLSR